MLDTRRDLDYDSRMPELRKAVNQNDSGARIEEQDI